LKTAAQHNAERTGHYEFKPGSNEALKTLFEACGWKVVTVTAKLPKRRKAKRKSK
jgi:hypothetical protein